MSFAVIEDDDERTLLEKAEKLQSGYIGGATQDGGSLAAATYVRLRHEDNDRASFGGKNP